MGSANDLYRRFRIYYSLLSIEKILNKSKSHILGAILKYGHSKFILEILEYCDSKDLIKREQYYIDLLKPEYNILKIAGSSFGRAHTKETKAKIALAMLGKKHSDETRKKISEQRLGKSRPKGSGRPSQKIEVLDLLTNERTIYDSIGATALALGIKQSTISSYFHRNQQNPYKGRFLSKGTLKP